MPGKIEPRLLLENADDGHTRSHDRRLRVFGQGEVALRSLPHDAREALRQRVVDFLKNGARRRESVGERLAHADGLAALTGENERARHDAGHKSAAPGQVKRRSAVQRASMRINTEV